MAGLTPTSEDRGATLPVVVPMSWVPRLNALARERGVARSALIRGVIESGLFTDRQMGEQASEQAAPVAAGK